MPELYSNFKDRPPPIALTPQRIRALGPHLAASGINADPDALFRTFTRLPVFPVVVSRPMPAVAGVGGDDGQA